MGAKEQVLNALKNSNGISTSRVAGIIGIDYNYALKILEKLYSENLIDKIETDNSTFWKLKEIKNGSN